MLNLRAIAATAVVLLCLTVAAACFTGEGGLSGCLAFVLNADAHPTLFIALMSLLPIIGFPISLFLVLAGVKFGLAAGLFLTAATMAVHLSVTFLVAHSMIQPYVDRFLEQKHFGAVKFSRRRKLVSLFIKLVAYTVF